MAAKSKKRLSKCDNKLLKLDKLQLNDVICYICQSILIEPVTLPCYHDFCLSCFNGSVENNALCCPLCRLRIGSWLRTATKQKSLVNVQLWDFIRSKFKKELQRSLRGEEVKVSEDVPMPRLSEPGEIRQEYETELKRLRNERMRLEQRHLHETELLVRKLQREEEEAQNRYLERLKQDELLAKEIEKRNTQTVTSNAAIKNRKTLNGSTKLKSTKIDSFIVKRAVAAKAKESPILTDDTSTDTSTPKPVTNNCKQITRASPELVPSYGNFLKNFLDKKIRNVAGLWNKENGGSVSKKEDPVTNHKEVDMRDKEFKFNKSPHKTIVQSLPVSLPYKGILRHQRNMHKSRVADETDSVDSMRQELCYFKPIESTTPISFKSAVGQPIKIPGIRVGRKASPLRPEPAPSRAQYLEGLCKLRNISLSQNLPSAFVLALKILQVKKGSPQKYEGNLKMKFKRQMPATVCNGTSLPLKHNNCTKNKPTYQIENISNIEEDKKFRRTRSMGSIPKNNNETTPKKASVKEKKPYSDRKPYLRSDSKKSNARKLLSSPSMVPEPIFDSHKLNSVVKNLSSPLKNCDVKVILEEQMRIEKLIEQEKGDLELARKIDAEWNGSRQLRRSTLKRQVSLNYTLRPPKKLKV